MLLERASRLSAKVTEYQKLRAMADEAEQFQTRANQLGAIAERVLRARSALEKFAGAGVELSFVASDGTEYAAKARMLRAAINEDVAAITNPPFDLKYDFIDRLAGLAGAAEKAVSDAWKNYVLKRADFGSSEVLDALAAVPQFRPSVTKIKQCRTSVAAFGNSLPADAKAAVARLDELAVEHDAAWSELSAGDIPATVIAFIRSAANEGATLAAYTEEVHTWLSSRSLLSAFRIRLG